MRKQKLRMNLQLFADPNSGQGGEGSQSGGAGSQSGGADGQQSGQQQFDYEKIASLIAGKQSVAEDTVLKNYFKQQGMSKEEMDSAISAFKRKRKEETPDPNALQEQIAQAQNAALHATIEKDGFMIGVNMGLDVKTIPYIIKMADLTEVAKEDGTVDQDKLKEAMNKVIADIPALKPNMDEGHGFRQVGSGGGAGGGDQSGVLAGIFGNSN